MRNWLFLLLPLLFLLFALRCSSVSEEDSGKELEGMWRLNGYTIDPGDGSGMFKEVESDKLIYFYSDRSFIANTKMCFAQDERANITEGKYDPVAGILQARGCNGKEFNQLNYSIEGEYLYVYYVCREGCVERFQREPDYE